jgi:hypothetical protein
MRSAGTEAAALLLLAVLVPVVGFWTTARDRTATPLALHHVVLAKEVRHEKKPGVDDACRLTLADLEGGEESVLRVECSLFHSIAPGAVLRKEAGERVLSVNDERVELEDSADSVGARALVLTPLAALLLGLAWAWRRPEE